METSLKENKYKNAVLYFIKYGKNSHFGKTKLNKLLYYLDFVFFRDNKHNITGDEYIRLEYGPVGKHIEDILQKLVKEGCLQIDDSRINNEYDPVKFTEKSEVNLDVFNQKECELLKKVNCTFLHYSTRKIVNQSHAEAPWLYAEMYHDIDYKLAEDIDII